MKILLMMMINEAELFLALIDQYQEIMTGAVPNENNLICIWSETT